MDAAGDEVGSGDWSSDLSSWKQRRKSRSTYQHVQDMIEVEGLDSEANQRKAKTFKEMVETSDKRPRNVGYYNYTDDDDDDGFTAGGSADLKLQDVNRNYDSFSQQSNAERYSDVGRVNNNNGHDNGLHASNFTDGNKKYHEKTIKFSQRPNHEKGFGFTINGGRDLNAPITVEKVVRGGTADLLELKAGDEILVVNGADVANHFIESVQAVIQQAIVAGQLELRIRRAQHRGDDIEDVFSDEEFEAELRQRQSTHRPVVLSDTLSSPPAPSHTDYSAAAADDEPPPLPAMPPPPVDWSTFPSAPPTPGKNDSSLLSVDADERDIRSTSPAGGSLMRGTEDQSRDELLRKRIEFLGLKPEESEEYRTVKEVKEVDRDTKAKLADMRTSAATFSSLDYRSDVGVSDVGLTERKVEETDFPMDDRRPMELKPSESRHPFNGSFGSSRSPKAETVPSPSLQNYSSTEERLQPTGRIGKELPEERPPVGNSADETAIKSTSDRKPWIGNTVEEVPWNRPRTTSGGSGGVARHWQPAATSIDREIEELRTKTKEDDSRRLREKEEQLRIMEEKVRIESEQLKREKEKVIEEREAQRLQRYVTPNAPRPQPTVVKTQPPPNSQPASSKQPPASARVSEPAKPVTAAARPYTGPAVNWPPASVEREPIDNLPSNRHEVRVEQLLDTHFRSQPRNPSTGGQSAPQKSSASASLPTERQPSRPDGGSGWQPSATKTTVSGGLANQPVERQPADPSRPSLYDREALGYGSGSQKPAVFDRLPSGNNSQTSEQQSYGGSGMAGYSQYPSRPLDQQQHAPNDRGLPGLVESQNQYGRQTSAPDRRGQPPESGGQPQTRPGKPFDYSGQPSRGISQQDQSAARSATGYPPSTDPRYAHPSELAVREPQRVNYPERPTADRVSTQPAVDALFTNAYRPTAVSAVAPPARIPSEQSTIPTPSLSTRVTEPYYPLSNPPRSDLQDRYGPPNPQQVTDRKQVPPGQNYPTNSSSQPNLLSYLDISNRLVPPPETSTTRYNSSNSLATPSQPSGNSVRDYPAPVHARSASNPSAYPKMPLSPLSPDPANAVDSLFARMSNPNQPAAGNLESQKPAYVPPTAAVERIATMSQQSVPLKPPRLSSSSGTEQSFGGRGRGWNESRDDDRYSRQLSTGMTRSDQIPRDDPYRDHQIRRDDNPAPRHGSQSGYNPIPPQSYDAHGRSRVGSSSTRDTRGAFSDYGSEVAYRDHDTRIPSAGNQRDERPDYNRSQSGSADYGGRSNQPMPTGYGQKQLGSADYGRSQPVPADYGRTQPGRADYGRNQPGSADYGRSQPVPADYGRTQPRSADYGRTQPGPTDYGRSQQGPVDYGRSQPVPADYGRSQTGSADRHRNQPTGTTYSDYGRNEPVPSLPTMMKVPVLYADADRSVVCSRCKRSMYGSLTHIRGNRLLCDNCHRNS